MKDYLVIGMDKKEQFRAYSAWTTGLVDDARQQHGTSPTASAALGRALSAGVLMSANLKGDDLLTLRILGDGPVGAVVVTADSEGCVRGYVQCPSADLPSKNGKLDVGGLVGQKGQLSVTKNMGLRDPYTGSIPLVSGEIGEDIAMYYLKSEQIPSVVGLGVLIDTDTTVKAAGGFLVQALPGAEEEELVALEERLKDLPNVSALVNEGVTPEGLLKQLLGDDFVVLETKPIRFRCNCSKEKLEKILISMGENELQSIIEQNDTTEIVCHFCANRHYFDRDELNQLLMQAKGK